MNMEKYDVKELVEKIYELDVKVYEATGSTMGKVFPAGKDLSVKKMLKHLDEDKRRPASCRALRRGPMVRSTRSAVSSLNFARVRVISRCLGPVASAVTKRADAAPRHVPRVPPAAPHAACCKLSAFHFINK